MSDLFSPQVLVPLLRDEPDFSGLHSAAMWEEIRTTAISRRMAQIVAYAIRPHASPEQRNWCDGVLVESWRLHDTAVVQLDYVLNVLLEARVSVLPLKGPVVALRHYSPPFLRKPPGDIDLAVRDSDLEAAAAALALKGYVAQGTLRQVRSTSHHLVMTCRGRPAIELHARLSHGARGIPVDDFFPPAVSFQLPTGRIVPIPAASDELFGLFLHFAHDRFASFFHLYELRKIWRAAAPETRFEVLTRAVDSRFSAALFLTDIAFRAWWQEGFLPPGFEVPQTWLQGHLNEDLLHALERNVFNKDCRSLSTRLRGRWLDLQVTDSANDAVRCLGLTVKVALYELLQGRWATVALKHKPPVGATLEGSPKKDT